MRWHLRLTEAMWNDLSKQEQLDWQAWSYKRQCEIERLNKVVREAKYPDPTSYIITLLALID